MSEAQPARGYYPVIVALFTATLIISNVTAGKAVTFFSGFDVTLGPIQVLPLITDGAFFLFPLAYLLGDVLSEVYGFKTARRTVFIGFAMLALTSVCFWIAVQLPPAEFYQNQSALESVIGIVPRFVIAGLIAYVVGQLLNSYVLTKIKQRYGEERLWVRLVTSTVVGQLADTLIFCAIVAGAIGITTAPQFINYVVVGWLWKTLVEVVMLPITYQVIGWLKANEPSYRPAEVTKQPAAL